MQGSVTHHIRQNQDYSAHGRTFNLQTFNCRGQGNHDEKEYPFIYDNICMRDRWAGRSHSHHDSNTARQHLEHGITTIHGASIHIRHQRPAQ